MMKPTTSYPTPLPFSIPLSLLHKICNPIEFFVSHLISLNTFVYLVSLNIAGGPRGGWGMWVGTTAQMVNKQSDIYQRGNQIQKELRILSM